MIFNRNKRSISSQAGFTLLEMLIAVTLVALMAVGLWAVFRISIRSWSQGTEFINANQHHRSILDLARKQIASAYPLVTPPPSRNEIQEAISPTPLVAALPEGGEEIGSKEDHDNVKY